MCATTDALWVAGIMKPVNCCAVMIAGVVGKETDLLTGDPRYS